MPLNTASAVEAGGRRFSVQRWRPRARSEHPPVVLVHASGLGVLQWGELAPHLARKRGVSAIQLLGYSGSSGFDDSEFEVGHDVAGVRSLLESHKRPAHLIGHSYGGLLALKTAMETPVASLCLLEPVCYGLLRALGDDAATRDLNRGMDRATMLDEDLGGSARWLEGFIDYWNGPGSWAALPERRRGAYQAVGRKVFREVQSVWINDTHPERYAAIDVPTTLGVSEHTTAGARRVVEVLHSLMPRARVHPVAGHGHLFPILDTAGTAALVDQHLTWSEQ